MNSFSYLAPTEIVFGAGVVSDVGTYAAKFGKKAIIVTGSRLPKVGDTFKKVTDSLEKAGVSYVHFDGVIPNPTTKEVTMGADMAKEFGAEVVIGLGGGSSIDTAKAIAVEATHEGSAWDYLHYTDGPTEKTLPIIAIGTTAGTGSQTTPCSVITKTENLDKSAIWHMNIMPKVAIVDPELTATLPPQVTAQTGFDAFCHNFEAYLSVGTNPMVEILALEGIRAIAEYLPRAYKDGSDMEARAKMSWADTLGGLAIASGGVTLPHGLGMQVGGHCPHVSHGQALAAFYPAFTRYTYDSAKEKFDKVGAILDPTVDPCTAIDNFLKKIDLYIDFKSLNVSKEDIRAIADCGQVLGDYKNNPRVATIDEMYDLMMECYER